MLFNEVSGGKYLKNTFAMFGSRTPSKKILKEHIENTHTKEKFQNTVVVVPNF